jgi:glycosyltransferase involved in cell wall biosynthesis
MRVGVNGLFFIPGEVGGTETYLIEILCAIAKHSPQVELVIFTNRENDGLFHEILNGYPQIEFNRLNFSARLRYMRIIREQVELPIRARVDNVDLLWSPGYTAPFICSCPQVVTIHDMQYKTHPEDLVFLARLMTGILVWVAAKRSCRVIADSEFARDEIVKYAKVPREVLDVIYAGVDPMFAARPSGGIIGKRISHIVNAREGYILCVANTYPHKNVHTLVHAFGQTLWKIPHQLVIIGKPGLGEGLLQRAFEALPDPGRVTRLSYVSRDELIALYQGASLFVFPSLYEGFGLPLLEAMMAGVPVVATRCGSIPEVGNSCVCYFDPDNQGDLAEKICQILYLEPDQKRAWCRRAQRRAVDFTWERTAEQILRCFENVLY